MKVKRSLAILLAAAMMTGSAGTALAAGPYSDAEKNAVSAALSDFTASYEADLEQSEPLLNGEKAAVVDMKLELGDTTRAMLGMAASFDISWFSNVGMKYSVTMKDAVEVVTGSLYVNDTDICTFDVYVDTATMTYYYRVPEILPYYLKVSMAEMYEEEMGISVEAMQTLMSDPMALYPDGQLLQDLLSRYLNIVFDGFESGEGNTTTVNLNGTEIEVMQYEGHMYEKNAYDMVIGLLETARDDEQLRELIEQLPAEMVMDEGGDVYGAFQSEIDGALSDLSTEEITEDSSEYISSVIWVDESGAVVGRGLSMIEGEEEYPVFTYQNIQNETDSKLSLAVNADDVLVSFAGDGKIKDGKLNGTYALSVDGTEAAEVEVIDYDIASMEAGALNGAYKLKLKKGFIEDESYNMLTAFALNLNCATDAETGAGEYVLELTTTGITLGSLTITGGFEDAEEKPEIASFENVLDVMSEEDSMKLGESLDWTPVLENCLAAGIPEDLVDMADQAIRAELYGSEEDML